ncbi:MAG: hypothetical protein UU47_C0001G0032 [candidate division TM6 bacterium GW2011_GWE2_41_16]|nr:MAG: hypothetical protein UU47_C0001G0032 [candidate division TM6 bacterium GW2011_GWE2_41_16]
MAFTTKKASKEALHSSALAQSTQKSAICPLFVLTKKEQKISVIAKLTKLFSYFFEADRPNTFTYSYLESCSRVCVKKIVTIACFTNAHERAQIAPAIICRFCDKSRYL